MATQPAAVRALGPALYWRCNGSDAVDLSGNGRNGVVGADVVMGVPGLRGVSCFQFVNAAGSWVTSSWAQSSMQRSLSLWLNWTLGPASGSSWNQTLLGASLAGATTMAVRAANPAVANTPARLQWVAAANLAAGNYLNFDLPYSYGSRWMHLAWVVDHSGTNRQVTLYLDGVPTQTLVAPAVMVASPLGGFTLGTQGVATTALAIPPTALVQDVALYDRLLTASEVAGLFAAQDLEPPPPPGPRPVDQVVTQHQISGLYKVSQHPGIGYTPLTQHKGGPPAYQPANQHLSEFPLPGGYITIGQR